MNFEPFQAFPSLPVFIMLNYLLYIDPGSGSYLIQVIAAAVLGIAFFFKTVKLYIIHYFNKIFGRKIKEEEKNN